MTVVERQAEIRETGTGLSLWPNALAALDALDLGKIVRGLGKPLADGGQRKLNGRDGPFFAAKDFVGALGEKLLCIDRGELVRTLASLLQPGTVRTSSNLTGFHSTTTSVVVEIDGSENLEVSGLVGADGINSAVASQIDGGLQFVYSGYTAWRGIANTVFDTDRNQIRACLAGGHEFGWMPVDDDRTYWFATAWLPEDFQPPRGDHAYLAGLFAAWPQPIPQLLAQTDAERLVRNNIVDRSTLSRWNDGPVTVLGDAAHPMRPHLGQGGCLAIEDAAALVECTETAGGLVEGFVRYERSRRARTDRIVRLSRRSGFTRPPGVATTIFDHLNTHLPKIPIGRALRLMRPVASYSSGENAVGIK